ncbi:MAG: gliding motility-associated protein GldE [Bacteroidales bacterium]|nr:gliding motility-associated protein GldE [Bacteroidales bacterium]
MIDPEPGQFILSYFSSISINLLSIFRGFSFESISALLTMMILLLFSGLISGSEIAFFSLSPGQREDIFENKDKKSLVVIHLLQNPKSLLAGILISNNFINIAIILLSTFLIRESFDFSDNKIIGIIIQIGIVTSLLLLFGEILPKIYAKQKAIVFVNLMANPLRIIIKLFRPIIFLLNKSTSLIDARLSKHKLHVSMEDLSDAVDLASELDNMDVDEEDQKILKGIATFGETDVKEIMKARVDVFAIEIDTPFSEVLNNVRDWGYSRIPVFEDSLDNIVGILYIKDILDNIDDENFEWNKKLRPAVFVPEGKKINDLLQEFRKKKIHIAIVADEYGGTSGIVTFEDIIEEIVGEISDEFDKNTEELQYVVIDDNTWEFEAKISLLDFCKVVGVDSDIFDELKGESESLAGLVLEIKNDFPKLKEKILILDFEFQIIEMDKRRINRIRIRKL